MSTPLDDPRGFLRALYKAAVARALPEVVINRFLPPPPKGRTLVIGAGKAGAAMAAAVDALWPQHEPLSGLVVTRYEHVPPAYKAKPGRIEVVEAAHPVPDAAGQRAAQRIAALAQGLSAAILFPQVLSWMRVTFADPAERADAAEAGDEQVEDDGLRGPALDLKTGLHAVVGGEHDEALEREVLLQLLQHQRIVVRAQNARVTLAHRRPPRSPIPDGAALRLTRPGPPDTIRNGARTVPDH